ncbi:hypothetical protein Y032_0024g1048 [Ancylostoma ceylanicum]|uniref:WAP domain-containing protein n=1 Tax=Ancylostoma ceylanicum TaxID=53326 RepID=A0A016UY12_9BILA|nr:hypothetical protein Y032_0024g1048 [Ancylostoma ceylanicum]
MSQRTTLATTAALLFTVFAVIASTSAFMGKASCSAEEYCPAGWRVQRKSNYDATTCDPAAKLKCEKPYQCVHSQCGISFCCAHQKTLNKWKEQKELEKDMEEDDEHNDL